MCVCVFGEGLRDDPSPMATGKTMDPSASSKYLQRTGQSEPSRDWPPATACRSASGMGLYVFLSLCEFGLIAHYFSITMDSQS